MVSSGGIATKPMFRVPAFPVQIVYQADSLPELAVRAPSPYSAISAVDAASAFKASASLFQSFEG
jgi:hypothetical protein